MARVKSIKKHAQYNPLYVYTQDYEQTTLEEYIQENYERICEWELRQSKLRCHYVSKTAEAGKMLEVEIYPCFLQRVDYNRAKGAQRTGKAQRKQNIKNSQRQFVRKAQSNFIQGDYFFHCGFDDEHQPKSHEDCHRHFTRFIDRIKYHMDRAGVSKSDLKYMAVIETNKAGDKFHIHAIFNQVAGSNAKGIPNRDFLENLWNGDKYPRTSRIIMGETGITGLSTYLTKQFEDDEDFDELSPGKYKKRWIQSTGLKQYTRPPRKNFTRFSKRRVADMLRVPAEMREVFEKEYPQFRYCEDYPCEVRYSEVADGYYLYCRMYRRE